MGTNPDSHYGMGITDNTIQFYVPAGVTYFSFGTGAAAADFTEKARLTAGGQLLTGITSSYQHHYKAANSRMLLDNSNTHTAGTATSMALSQAEGIRSNQNRGHYHRQSKAGISYLVFIVGINYTGEKKG